MGSRIQPGVEAEGRQGQRPRNVITAIAAALAVTLSPIAAQAHPGGGWGGDRGGGWRGHRDRGPDAGDVIGGLLVLGGIVAIASAISSKNRDDEARVNTPPRSGPYPTDGDRPVWKEPSWQDRDPRWDAVPPPPSATTYGSAPTAGQGAYGWQAGAHDPALDNAVEACAAQARSRGGLDQIWDVARDGEGYRVRGNLATGNPFICNVGRNGRVGDLAVLPQDGRATREPGSYDGAGAAPVATRSGATGAADEDGY